MILYLDTSSLLKLYVQEPGTQDVQVHAEAVDRVATSVIAYPEAHAALARRHREGVMNKSDFKAVVEDLRESWHRFLVIHLSLPVAVKAGALAVRYGLRGMDAIHLASYAELLNHGDVEFLSHDTRLMHAAHKHRASHRRGT